MDHFSFIQNYVNKMKVIQEKILSFIENQDSNEETLTDIINYIDQEKIRENPHDLRLLLQIISQISKCHYRHQNFFGKITKILQKLKEEIRSMLTNQEIYVIFKFSLPILIFLNEEGLFNFDENILYFINSYESVAPYFFPEFKKYFGNCQEKYNYIVRCLKKNHPNIFEEIEKDEFNEKRKNGESDSYLCELIQKDSVEEFISFVNRSNLSLSETAIKLTCFETNFLILNEISMIEYAAFYGSIQIFQYLKMNGVQLTPSLWPYAIHSKNQEIIRLLEENKVEPEDKTFNECFLLALQCHHNEVAQYIHDNLMTSVNRHLIHHSLLFFNFSYLSSKIEENKEIFNDAEFLKVFFNDLCSNDCYVLVDYLLNNMDIDINAHVIILVMIIFNTISIDISFLYYFKSSLF
ncbi:hypothetical protein M9Y10_042907 [Tritrichomonas musculus]|uniref:DUF3447 domain-containing protein n=1 Tax=Tritrichomonas musculus TaxID=1915356 RepID=A0ABR2GLF0_9EUKA